MCSDSLQIFGRDVVYPPHLTAKVKERVELYLYSLLYLQLFSATFINLRRILLGIIINAYRFSRKIPVILARF